MSVIIGIILPYLTVIVFLGGVFYRISTWRKMPSPPMTLYPAETGMAGRAVETLKETFLFKRLFEGDMVLWILGGLFHVLLAVTFIDHYDRILAFAGITGGSLIKVPLISGGPAGIALLVFTGFLLLRRLVVSRAAQVSSFSDYFMLLLILAIVITGDVMRFSTHYDVAQTRAYFSGLLTFSFKALPGSTWFVVHYILGLLLFMVMPFSKMLHFGGIFFTQAAVHKH
jgi:nitrate reductase gamma subunit